MTSRAHNLTTRRPLPSAPPLPRECGGGNVRLLEEGGGRVVPKLDLGSCGLDRPLKRGQGVTVEVAGTGYFSVVVRSASLGSLISNNSKKDKIYSTLSKDDVIDEVKFKLKKSKFVIEVSRKSRAHVHVLATANGANTSKYDVTVSHGLDPWVTFNVLFGDLRLVLIDGGGKHERPWQFHSSHGLNINLRKTHQEAEAIRCNPCATVVTERPLDKGEVMEVSVEPHCADSHSEVKIFLTHNAPQALKLQNPRVFFHEHRNVDRFLHEVYVIKKFKGILSLRIDTEAGVLDVQEDTNEGHTLTQPATRSIDLFQHGLNVRKPVHVCLEILRTSVHIRQRQKGRDSSYAEPVPGQGVEETPEYLDMSAGESEDDYLKPRPSVRPPMPAPADAREGIQTTALVHPHPAPRPSNLAPTPPFLSLPQAV